jgi:hypothetical protein
MNNMMPVSGQQACNDIVGHITHQGGALRSWYVGITSDWDIALFDDHNVPRVGHSYIVRQCFNSVEAAQVTQTILRLGCDGGGDTVAHTSVYVYAYLKGPQTVP